LVGQLSTETEVGDLDPAVGVKEDVVGLDVAVDDALAVQMAETFACLS
jgi:hypothetical protein